ncbi:MAG: CHAT domain-containing protein [Holophagales bacterium]|nr:CHAT domain-containing protein [Holophagales bacterium]
MNEVRTVTLELLRHGPAMAQMLSSDTEYLALCGGHAPETVQLALEHDGLVASLRGLCYEEAEAEREMQLETTARRMTDLLGRVPGLLAELAGHAAAGARMVQLRLVIAGDELAMLPFELAEVPRGAPGAGQPLVLQSDLPICLTRQVRRVGTGALGWPERPRVLFAYAEPDDVGSVPHGEHRRSLEHLLGPWIPPRRQPPPGALTWDRQQPQLVVLRRASFEDLHLACARESFTHVHLLAHGAPFERGGRRSFGVAFHHPEEPERHEAVDGERLALALRGDQVAGGPAVVTLASCDSANAGTLAEGGSSVAHELHQAGIPLVVASQFPLSVEGSVELVRRFYGDLLWGSDPRRALFDLRRSLRLGRPRSHDWASLVAYASLPEDLGPRLARHRIRQANAAVHNSLDWADHLMARITEDPDPEPEEWESELSAVLAKLEAAKERLAGVSAERHEDFGLRASAEKREAQVLHLAATRLPHERSEAQKELARRSLEALEEARAHYRQAFRSDLRANWAVAQYLCLCQVLGRPDPRRRELWVMGRMAAENDLEQGPSSARQEPWTDDPAPGRRAVWAHSTLCELLVLGMLLPGVAGEPDDEPAPEVLALEHAAKLAEMADRFSIDVYATRQQLLRYRPWFARLEPSLEPILPTVDRMLELLPERGHLPASALDEQRGVHPSLPHAGDAAGRPGP